MFGKHSSSNKSSLTPAIRPASPKGFWHLRNHPFVVPVVTFLLLFFVALVALVNFGATTVGASDSRVVNVFVDGDQQIVPTRATTVGDLLDRLDITIHEGDIVEPPPETPIQEDNFTINVYRARPVTVIDGSRKVTLLTAAQSPKAIAKQAGLTLQPEDEVKTVSNDSVLKDPVLAQQLVVARATPVSLNLYGQAIRIRTHAKTVNDLLKERGLSAEAVSVFPASDSILTPDIVVYVTDPGKEIELVMEEVPFPIEYIDDYNLSLGSTKIRTEGKPGKRAKVYENPKGRPDLKQVREVPLIDPVPQVVVRGRKINTASVSAEKVSLMAAAGISSADYAAADYIIQHESRWRPGAVNPGGCYGLGQACPGSKLVVACPDWSNDPVCQLRFFHAYANRTYGGWQRAAVVKQVQGWW